MASIESYLQSSSIPQAAKADAWEAYQTPDHDSFVSSVGKLSVPQNVKADMYEMRYGANSVPLAPIPAPANPITAPQPTLTDKVKAGLQTVKDLYNKPIPTVSAETRAAHPKSAAAFQAVADFAGKPLIPQSAADYLSDVSKHASTIPGSPNASAILTGVDQGMGTAARGLSTPGNIATMAAMMIPGVAPVAEAGFGLQAGVGAAKEGYAAKQSYDQGNLEGAAEHGTGAVVNAAFSGLGLRGLIHDGTPPVNPQSPETPAAVDHPTTGQEGNQSVTPLQGQLFPQSEHSVPSASNGASGDGPVASTQQLALNFHPGQRDLFHQHGEDYTPPSVTPSPAKEPVTPEQMQLMPWQGNLFPKDAEATPDSTTPNPAQLALNPAQGRMFSVRGEALPPQEGEAGLMSPEAEATSKAAQAEATQNVSPQAPSVSTEGPIDSGDTPLKTLEDSIRSKTGQVMKLDQLVDGNQKHAALERAIDDYQSTLDPRRNAGPGITPEDRKTLSIAMGEKVGSTLTADQVDKAYALRGKVMSETPELQLRPKASKDRIAASRGEMAKDMETTQDPDLKAKLQDALQPDPTTGEPKPFLYEPARKNAPAVDLSADHPEAPFGSKTFGATYPSISLDNLETALGQRPRSVDMGLGDPEMKAQLQGLRPTPTAEGTGTVKASSDGFGTDVPNNPKGYTGDAKILKNEYLEGAVRAKRGQIASSLKDDVKAYQNLRDVKTPSDLINDLKNLHPDSLPKEVRELVKPPKPEARETNASAATRIGNQTAEARNTPKTSEVPTLGKAQRSIGKVIDSLTKSNPENLDHVQTLVKEAADHFGDDTDGAMVATYNALKVFKQGLDQGDDWAMRNALKEIRRQTPYGDMTTRNAGITPKDVAKSAANIKNYIKPPLTDADRLASADYAANAYLSRYEKMSPSNRAAYHADMWSDETDRKVQEGDPDGQKGYKDRLDALRGETPPHGLYARLKGLMDSNEDKIMAEQAKRTIQTANGYRNGFDVRMRETFNKFSATLDQWSNFESREFIHNMEMNQDQGDAFKNQVASVLRSSLDDARNRITAVNGDFQKYLDDYFPHIWGNVGKGMELARQMGGMTGNESFLKAREYDTFNEGIKQGLSPVSFNPVKLTMMRVEQMNRYAMKESIAQDFISSGKAQIIKPGEPVPEGTTALEDPAFQRAAGLGGKYYAPDPVAKVFNNFVSKGLAGKLKVPLTQLSAYDTLRAINNTQNQFELGLSGMHAVGTTINSFASQLSRGMATGVNGLLRGDGAAVAEGIKTSVSAFNVRQRYLFGRNLIAHMKNPDTFQEMSSIADAFMRAGGRIGVDKVLGTSYADKFNASYKEAMDANLPKDVRTAAFARSVGNQVGRTLESFSKPIMEHLVPNLKAGAFAMDAQDILSKHVGQSQDFIDGELQRSWNNMDDRFGQPVYDNYFMNKVTKDIAMVTMRSPGWNIGTFRAGAGGITDAIGSVKDAITKKQRLQITDRTAYLGALVATTMGMNAIINVGMTGSVPHGLDYFFPRTGTKDDNGEDNRLMPKTYVYDFMNMVRTPVTTALHKMSPLMGTINDLYANKSFYGREIYDPGSSAAGRIAQMALYVGKSYEPFSISNYQEQKTRGASGLTSLAGSMAGILPAPKWAGRSDAEQLASDYHAGTMAQGGEEGAVFDTHQKYVQLQADVRSGKVTTDELTKRVNSGEIPVSFVDHMFDKQSTPNLERWTKGLSSTRAMEVFDRATPAEKERLMPIMASKLDKLDPSEMQAYADKLTANAHHPDTHVFSVAKYAAANPGADHQAAASQAQQKGYEVRQ